MHFSSPMFSIYLVHLIPFSLITVIYQVYENLHCAVIILLCEASGDYKDCSLAKCDAGQSGINLPIYQERVMLCFNAEQPYTCLEDGHSYSTQMPVNLCHIQWCQAASQKKAILSTLLFNSCFVNPNFLLNALS